MTKKMKNKKRNERKNRKKLIETAIRASIGRTITIEKQRKIKGMDERFGSMQLQEQIRTFTEEKFIPPDYKMLNSLIKAGILGK